MKISMKTLVWGFAGLIFASSLGTAPALAVHRDVQVSANNDDAEEHVTTGDMNRSSSDLELVDEDGDSDDRQLVGMRFRNLRIPAGATITSAVLEFTADNSDTGSTSLTIEGEDVDDASQFSNSDDDISDRTRTTASASWSPTSWTAGERYQSSDISSIVQEIVDRGGWSSGNDMVFIVTGSGERDAVSHNDDDEEAPILRVEYDGFETMPGGTICYGVSDGGDQFVLIDSADGTVDTDIGDVGVSNIEAIALDPDDFSVFASNNSELGRIDVDSGRARCCWRRRR